MEELDLLSQLTFSGFLGSGVACVGVCVIVRQLYIFFLSITPHSTGRRLLQ